MPARRELKVWIVSVATSCLVLASQSSAQEAAPLMTPRDLMALPVSAPDHVIAYGDASSQFGELRVPAGPGPHPVVVLIHGGCFKAAYATLRDLAPIGDALKKQGVATWSIEYRRLGEAGGGWPGTYRDTGTAIDFLRTLAPQHRLDLTRVVILGHSAGGHLAHWAGGRARLAPSSPLFMANPIIPAGVINLAGRMDMAEGIEAHEAKCEAPVVRELLGGLPAQVPDRYADVSPANRLPMGVRQILIWGSREDYVPIAQAERYVAAARRAGDDARLITVEGAWHFETASPSSSAWPIVARSIETLLTAPAPTVAVSRTQDETAPQPVAVFDHIALQVANLEASVAFYRDVFGFAEVEAPFPIARWMRMGDGLTLHMVSGRSRPVDQPKWVHFAVACRDMDEMIARLNAKGIPWSDIQDRHAPQLRPDGVQQIFVRDPDGYWIEINDALPQ